MLPWQLKTFVIVSEILRQSLVFLVVFIVLIMILLLLLMSSSIELVKHKHDLLNSPNPQVHSNFLSQLLIVGNSKPLKLMYSVERNTVGTNCNVTLYYSQLKCVVWAKTTLFCNQKYDGLFSIKSAFFTFIW